QGWMATRSDDLPSIDRDFIAASVRRDAAERAQREGMRRHAWQMSALAATLILGIGAGLTWSSRAYLRALAITWAEIARPKMLSADAERTLPPGQRFQECADCPEMVIVPAGTFMMGSPTDENGHDASEEPQHEVSIQRFAISRTEITFAQWDAC